MRGVIVGHGWHDGVEKVLVPEGVQLDFLTDEDTPMQMANLLAVVARGEAGIPLDSAAGGEELPSYSSDAFTDEQFARLIALNRMDPADAPMYLVGSADLPLPSALCTDLAGCPALGPHACQGVLGLAARAGLTHLQILACRVSTVAPGPVTRGPHR